MWVLYARTEQGKRRRRIKAFTDEGEACAMLCYVVLHAPDGDWKLRKVKTIVEVTGEA